MKARSFETPPRRVALFVTCMVDMLYPEVGWATVRLLEQQGLEVLFPAEQTCCGQPAFNAGYHEEARRLADRFLSIFGPLVERGEVDAVVAPSGSCVTMTSHFYEMLFAEAGSETARTQAKALAAATWELSAFLVDGLGVTETGGHYDGTLAYHACCHLLRELRVDVQPRALLAGLAGAELVELAGAEECCGFGGLFAIKNAPISTAMGRRKVRHVIESGADVVAMCDVSCMTHINGILQRERLSCRARHLAELLDPARNGSE